MSRDNNNNPLEDLLRAFGIEPHKFDADSDECKACEHFAECEAEHEAKAGNDNHKPDANEALAVPLKADDVLPADVVKSLTDMGLDMSKATVVKLSSPNVLPMPVDPLKPAALSMRPPPLTPEEFMAMSYNPTHGMASFLIGRLIQRKDAGMPAIDFDMGVEAIRFSLRDRMQ